MRPAWAQPTARRLRAALAAGALVLAGCASLAPPTGTPLSGRLSVQVAAHAGEPARAMNAAFDLQGDATAGELRLSSTLGPQVAAARWSPGQVTLETGEGAQHYADLDSLSREVLGEALPLQALPDWLHGRPWQGAPSRPLADGFEQLGWTLGLARLAEGFVVATRERAPAVTLRARMERP